MARPGTFGINRVWVGRS